MCIFNQQNRIKGNNQADGYYIKECYDNNKDNHVYIDEDLCYFNKLA